ncbi:MAG: UvrD-helicase domain-containing protein [Chthonomonadaceae bacterium]|nr:UvrD-helicase domain-containing protein [Chthonomonadaceae bacterium]
MSGRIELSAEQRAVVEAVEGELVVLAAAGAGKTRVLVERYLRIVREGTPPDAILTITFTRKAAAEMKRRIVDALREEGRAEDAQTAETGPIQTIHAFCQRLLRENALEAGVDPDVEILADAQASRLLEDAIESTLAHPPEGDEVDALIATLAGRRSRWEARSAHAGLKSAVRRVLDTLRGSGLSPDEIERSHASADAVEAAFSGAFLAQLDPRVRSAYSGDEAALDFDALARAYKECRIRAPRWLRQRGGDARAAAANASGLVRIACAAWRIAEEAMAARQAFDFCSLEARAVALLADSPATRERLRTQYRAVLVDEAQDVNPVQYRLLDALGIDPMLVGDPQQSIYGFRLADVRLFRERALASDPRLLRRNYRSDPGILAFVDRLFGGLWGETYRPMRDEAPLDLASDTPPPSCEGVEIWLQRQKDSASVARGVSELVRRGTRPKDVAVLVRSARFGIDLVERLAVEGVPARMVGGSERFFTRLEVRDVANMLRALTDPRDDFALLAALGSPMVGLSLDSIVCLAGESLGERLAAFSPPLEEDRALLERFLAWFESLRAYADRLGAWEVIAEVFAKSPYLEALAVRPDADQRLANVRKLLRLAVEEPELGPSEFAERIRGIQALQHKEGDAPAMNEDVDAVTVMTVHKAKGLEFPVVIVPDTHTKIARRPNPVVADPWLGLVAASYGGHPGWGHLWLSERLAEREREEELRVLYVALTRARHRLIVCAHPQATGGSLAELIGKQAARGDRLPPGLETVELERPAER